MRKTTRALLCASLLTGSLLAGCSQEDIETAKETASKVGTVIDEKAEQLGVKEHVDNLKDEAAKAVNNAKDAVKDRVAELPEDTKKAAADLLDAAGEKAKEAGEAATEKAEEIKAESTRI